MKAVSSITVRFPNSIHLEAKLLASADGASINSFIVSAVAEKIAALRAVGWLRKRAPALGSPERLLAILAEAPEVPPMAGDELAAPKIKRRK